MTGFHTRVACAVLLLLHGYAIAQPIEEVTIHAEQQTDEMLDDLVSGSSISAEKLADAGIENVEDVAAYVPNLVLTQTETGTSIVIRGIGAGVNQGFDQSVGLYVDGVPLPRANMARAPFLDLSNVQVLRGPQYVLDGNYSIAGSVHLLTDLSAEEFQAGIELNYTPSQNDKTASLTVGMPFNDMFAARVAIQSKRSDGYIENVTLNDSNRQEDLVGRLVLGFNPTESLTFKLKVERGSFDAYGRATEIIYDSPTPKLEGIFGDYNQNGIRDIDPNTGNLEKIRQPTNHPKIAWPYLREVDYINFALGTQYRAKQLGTNKYWFSNQTYLGKLASLYEAEGVPVPGGLTDGTLNYKRGANVDEYSFNDSINYTLNADWWLGDHVIRSTSSYVEYNFTEQIDSDGTAAPLLVTSQKEDYQQIFQQLEYQSPEGGFIEFKAGGSYLWSKLDFRDRTQFEMSVTSDASVGQFGCDASRTLFPVFCDGSPTGTTPEPIRPYLGSFALGNTALNGFERFVPDRIFKQDVEVIAGFMQTKFHWTGSLRSTIGLRYTHAEKQAVRDFAFLDDNGNPPQVSAKVGQLQLNGFFKAYAQIFGMQAHSDRMLRRSPNGAVVDVTGLTTVAARGERVENKLLPSLTLEWDINDEFTTFVSIRKANKLGGFDARANTLPDVRTGWGAPAGTFEFEDEDATAYELGLNWVFPNGWGEMKVVAFLNKFNNLQVSRADGKSGFNVVNASAATSTGVEVEGLLQLTDSFNVNYSLAWIDFQFDEFPLGTCHLGNRPDYFLISQSISSGGDQFIGRTSDGAAAKKGDLVPIRYEGIFRPEVLSGRTGDGVDVFSNYLDDFDNTQLASPGFCDFAGKSNQYVAEWQGTFTFNYEKEIIDLGLLKPTLDVIYNSGYETTVSQDPLAAQAEYVQLNARLALVSFEDTWTVALTAQNLTNQKIVSYANETPIGARFQGARGFTGFVRPPRSIGINLRYKFY